MADPVAAATDAPKQVFKFAEHHLLAFILLVVLLMVIFVKMETYKPGSAREKVSKIPLGIGKWATTPKGA
jgi:hypothetical protein